MGFPGGSDGKESTCNAGDPSLIPGMGRSTEEGISYPLQYSWASLVAQLVKNLPSVWETWVWPLGWGRSPGEENGYPFSILAWRIPWTEEPGELQSIGSTPFLEATEHRCWKQNLQSQIAWVQVPSLSQIPTGPWPGLYSNCVPDVVAIRCLR